MTKIAAIDFETANSSPASVCSVGVVSMAEGVIEDSYYSLIHPESNVSSFSYWNVQIHGIQPEDVENAPSFEEVYRDLINIFSVDTLVCAHNAKFDMTCLRKTCANTGRKIPYLQYFDTLELSRKVFPKMRHHRLNDMCDLLEIELDHHNALSDAQGCLLIVDRIMELTDIYDIHELLQRCGVRVYDL